MKYYNRTNSCDICGEKFGKVIRERDENKNWTGNWICITCYDNKRRHGTYFPVKRSNCDRCGEKFSLSGHGNPYKEKKDGIWTKKLICHKCYMLDYQDRPDSTNNIFKSLADHRIGNIKLNNQYKGDLFQELTCIWRSTISIIPVEDLNKKLDNYKSPIDHSRDSELGIVQTKGSWLKTIKMGTLEYYAWLTNWKNEHDKEFDNLIFYCVSRDGKIIERIYIFPKKDIIKRKTVYISTTSKGWYEKYRVKDAEELKKVNDIWNEINKSCTTKI